MANTICVEGRLSDGLPMRLFLAERDGLICHASMHDDTHPLTEDEFIWRTGQSSSWTCFGSGKVASPVLDEAVHQAVEYFASRRLVFDVALHLQGTPFQTGVWRALMAIPFGTRKSYREVAEAIGQPNAFRAVGNANGRNKLPLFVPCHRVIAAGGKLGGFTGGIGLKKRLLAHEDAVLGRLSAG